MIDTEQANEPLSFLSEFGDIFQFVFCHKWNYGISFLSAKYGIYDWSVYVSGHEPNIHALNASAI